MAMSAVRMRKGLHNNTIEDVLAPEKYHDLDELEERGISKEDIAVRYYEHGRFTTCVITVNLSDNQEVCSDCPKKEKCSQCQQVGNSFLAECDQPNRKIGRTIARSRAVENFIKEYLS